jgi:DNA-binding NarL/FixJ family response regulator
MPATKGAKTSRTEAPPDRPACGAVDRAVHLYDLPLDSGRLVVLSFDVSVSASNRLTSAERGVAILAAEGLSTRAIAARRGASLRTVSNQLASVYEKLGVRSRFELAARLTEGCE